MADDAAELLIRAGHIARDICDRQKRNIEAVAGADEARRLVGGVDINAAGQRARLICDHADRASAHADKPRDHVCGIERLRFKENMIVRNLTNDLFHVVGLLQVLRNEIIEHFAAAFWIVLARKFRRHFPTVLRQVAQKRLDLLNAVLIVFTEEVRHAGNRVVRVSSPQFFGIHHLARHVLDDFWAGNERLTGLVHRENKIRQRRGIHRTAGTRTHDGGDLRDHTGGHYVVIKDRAVGGRWSFLNTAAAGVVHAHERHAGVHRQLLNPLDLHALHFAHGAAKHGKVMRKGEYSASINQAIAGHNAFGRRVHLLHAKIMAAVLHKNVVFLKCAFIKQQSDALAGRQLPLFMLLCNLLFAAALHDVFLFLQHDLKLGFFFHKTFTSLCTAHYNIVVKVIQRETVCIFDF